MSLNNNLLNSNGFVQKDKHTRPEKLNPVKTRKNYIEQKLVKQSSLADEKCPKGTRWHRKLAQCISSSNIELLKNQRKPAAPANQRAADSRSVLKDALARYGKTDRI